MNQDYQSLPWAEKLRIAEAAKPGDVWISNEHNYKIIVCHTTSTCVTFRHDDDNKLSTALFFDTFTQRYHPAPPAEEKPVTSISIQLVITDPDLVEYYAKESDAEIVDQILLGDLYTGVSIQRVERIRG